MIKTTLKLSELHKARKNVRKHSQSQIAEYMRSVEMFGQLRPIVVSEDYEILAGNGLYDAMTGLGMDTADVYIMQGLTEAKKKKLMLADNRIFNLGSDDMSVFEEFIAELDGDFDVPGYDIELLKTLTFEDDDVDEAMSGYGKISEDDKERLKNAAERYEREEDDYTSGAVEVTPRTHESEALQQRYIVCPKCGEKIWL